MTERHCGEIHGLTGVCCALAPGHAENHRGAFGQVSAQWPVSASATTPKPDSMTERAQALEAAIEAACETAIRMDIPTRELVARIRQTLAVQPPPPVGSPTTDYMDIEPEIRVVRIYRDGSWLEDVTGGGRRRASFPDLPTPVEPAGASEPPSDYIDIVFDGPPASESGRFIEVENAQGASIRVGEWVHRPDGYWALRLPAPVSPVEPTPNDTLLRNIRMAAAMGLSFGHQATPQPMERMVERKDKRLRQILTLLAEHGVTGPMLRAESNAPVEPTPEPPKCVCSACEPLVDPGQRPSLEDINRLEKAAWDSKTDRVLVWYRDQIGLYQQRIRETERAWQLERKQKPTGAPAPCVWRDIASAPKDETPIRLKWAGTTVEAIGRWCPAQVLPSGFGRSNYSDDWRDVEGDDVLLLPTHWKPVIVSGSPLKVER